MSCMFDDEDEATPAPAKQTLRATATTQRQTEPTDDRFRFDQNDAERVMMSKRKPEQSANEANVSKFSNSIAAALELKDSNSLELVARKLKRDRENEKHVPQLVERDLSVGIFVTPAYKKVLKKLKFGDTSTSGDADSSSEDERILDTTVPMQRADYYDSLVASRETVTAATAQEALKSTEVSYVVTEPPAVSRSVALAEQRDHLRKRLRTDRILARLPEAFIIAARERFLSRQNAHRGS